MRHGQRPVPSRHEIRLVPPKHEIAEFLRKPAQETLKWVEQVLADGQLLSKKDEFCLNQVLTAAERLVVDDEKKKEELRKKLEDAEDKGEKLGFDVDKIRGMNAAAFLIANQRGLQAFIKQAKERLGGKDGRS